MVSHRRRGGTPMAHDPPSVASSTLPVNPGPWIDAQWRAICTTGRSLLVSAAAGSGKTAVLAERCAYLVCDAPAEARCGVDELLVVTFTNAAAAEMRDRIERALRKRLSSSGGRATRGVAATGQIDETEPDHDPRLAHQLALIDRAQISTLHGFCSQVLRQHFHLIGIDPNFTLLAEEEAVLLRNDVARDLFDHHYTTDKTGEFQQLIDRYGDGDDQRLIGRVIHTHNLLNSIIAPDAWLAAARKRIDDGAADLGKSALGKELVVLLREQVAAFRRRCVRTAEQLDAMGEFTGYVDVLGEYIAAADEWATLEGPTLLSRAVQAFAHPDLPRMPSAIPNKELAKKLIDGIRDELKPRGALFELLRFTAADWQDGLRRTRSPADVFLRLVGEFSDRYRKAKDELRAMDFNDLERFTLQILRDGRAMATSASPAQANALVPSQAAREYHARFRYVLVDEYQDINPIQDAILTLVSRECLETDDRALVGATLVSPADGNSRSRATQVSPLQNAMNLFCVGDVKQSIYRFRLAEPARFTRRY